MRKIKELLRFKFECSLSIRKFAASLPFSVGSVHDYRANASYKECPQEIKQVLCELLGRSILSIRSMGTSDDAAGCALEADLIHNLPDLIADYDPARLKYFVKAEIPSYLSGRQHLGRDLPDSHILFFRKLEQHDASQSKEA